MKIKLSPRMKRKVMLEIHDVISSNLNDKLVEDFKNELENAIVVYDKQIDQSKGGVTIKGLSDERKKARSYMSSLDEQKRIILLEAMVDSIGGATRLLTDSIIITFGSNNYVLYFYLKGLVSQKLRGQGVTSAPERDWIGFLIKSFDFKKIHELF